MTVSQSFTPFEFHAPARIVCEAGSAGKAGQLMKDLGAGKVLVVCDPGVVKAGLLSPVTDGLRGAGLPWAVFAEVEGDPPEDMVRKAAHAAMADGCDGVIGLGGGSSLDTAKLVAAIAGSGLDLGDMLTGTPPEGPRTPLIQIPTTAGTGSEVTSVSVVTTRGLMKQAISGPALLPDVAILDPEMTVGLPPQVTAATGMDAIVHAIEGYTSRTRKNPVSDACAIKGLALLVANIGEATRNGSNMAARAAMLQGSMLAGLAFINASVAAVHALAYPLGARFHVHHGLGNSLVLAPVMRFNLTAAEPLYAELAGAAMPGQDFSTPREAAGALCAMMERLPAELGLETRLSPFGVTVADCGVMAADVIGGISRLISTNPCDMTQRDVEEIYESIL